MSATNLSIHMVISYIVQQRRAELERLQASCSRFEGIDLRGATIEGDGCLEGNWERTHFGDYSVNRSGQYNSRVSRWYFRPELPSSSATSRDVVMWCGFRIQNRQILGMCGQINSKLGQVV